MLQTVPLYSTAAVTMLSQDPSVRSISEKSESGPVVIVNTTMREVESHPFNKKLNKKSKKGRKDREERRREKGSTRIPRRERKKRQKKTKKKKRRQKISTKKQQ